jgi:hypothetical protein
MTEQFPTSRSVVVFFSLYASPCVIIWAVVKTFCRARAAARASKNELMAWVMSQKVSIADVVYDTSQNLEEEHCS